MIALIQLFLGKTFFFNKYTTMLTGAVLLIGSLYTWHLFDKNSAIKRYLEEYVTSAELDTAKAQLAALEAKIAASEDALALLNKFTADQNQSLKERDDEIANLIANPPTIYRDCVAQPDHLERLRSLHRPASK